MVIASDLEGTLTTGESERALIAYLRQSGRERRTARGSAPRSWLARIGLLRTPEARGGRLTELAGSLAGMTEEECRDLAFWVVDNELWPKRRVELIDELLEKQRAGWLIVLAAATYQPILEAFALRLDAEAVGTELQRHDGVLTGGLIGSINSGRVKAERLLAELEGESIYSAYGDSEDDIPMLQLSEEAVAVHPDAGLRREAAARGWRIIG